MTTTRFERLTSRTGNAWVAGTAVAVLVVLGGLAAADPDAVGLALVLLLLAAAVAVVLRSRQEVVLGGAEPLLVQRRSLRTTRVGLHSARRVSLRGDLLGVVQVLAEGPQRPAFAPVLALTSYVQRSQPEPVLRALVTALDGSRAAGAAEVRSELQAQVAHLLAGGAPQDSPLARHAGR